MKPEELDAVIQRMREGVRDWLDECVGVPGSLIDRQPAPGVWSIKQNTFHLGDAIEATLLRLESMLQQDDPQLLRFDADKWAADRRYQERSWSEAVSRLTAGLGVLLSQAISFGPDQLARTGRQPNIAINLLGLPTEQLTVADLLRFEAAHVEEHLTSVRAILADREVTDRELIASAHDPRPA
ncbi:MAG TPA: DinB family protein [Kineosporiaceae bacterium]|nr:DinB family protein [Kineosporiaceae bacterium]